MTLVRHRGAGTVPRKTPESHAGANMQYRSKVCEKCSFSELERVPRVFWMRVFYKLRYYHCDKCDVQFLAAKELVEQRQWMNTTTTSYRPGAEGTRKKA
jgi:hypothetical protein